MNKLFKSIVCCVRSQNILENRTKKAIKTAILNKEEVIESSHGYVKKVKIKNKFYACKTYYNKETYIRELRMLKRMINSKYLQRYRFSDTSKLKIYSDYEGKDLFKWLEERGISGTYPIIDDNIIKKIGKNILLGINEIIDRDHVHLDIKPENIILKDNFDIKIIDFDTAKKLHDESYFNITTRRYGTSSYMSPEMYYRKKYSKTTDLWSLGIVLWILKAGTYPYETIDDVTNNIENFYGYNTHVKNCPKFCNLMNLLFEVDHKKRINIEETLNHPYFEMINL